MIEFIAVVIFAALIWFFLRNHKKKSENATVKTSPAPAKPIQQKANPVEKVAAPAEKVPEQAAEKPTVAPVATAAVVIESKPVIKQDTSLVPQDSMLKRHYLTHVHAMMAAISSARPTDSSLARHYDTQLTANIGHYVSNEAAMEKLLAQYADCQKSAACPAAPAPVTAVVAEAPQIIEEVAVVAEPEVIVEAVAPIETADESITTSPQHEASIIPTDSTLRRHYLTHLYSQVAVTMNVRPTDATLRRHYDAMLANEIENQLSK
jgi:hypothetical protein